MDKIWFVNCDREEDSFFKFESLEEAIGWIEENANWFGREGEDYTVIEVNSYKNITVETKLSVTLV